MSVSRAVVISLILFTLGSEKANAQLSPCIGIEGKVEHLDRVVFNGDNKLPNRLALGAHFLFRQELDKKGNGKINWKLGLLRNTVNDKFLFRTGLEGERTLQDYYSYDNYVEVSLSYSLELLRRKRENSLSLSIGPSWLYFLNGMTQIGESSFDRQAVNKENQYVPGAEIVAGYEYRPWQSGITFRISLEYCYFFQPANIQSTFGSGLGILWDFSKSIRRGVL